MKATRRLSLRRESLFELATSDLRLVAGAAGVLSRQDTKCTLDPSYVITCANSITCQTTFNTCDC